MNRRSFSKGLHIHIKTLNFDLLYTKGHVSLEECYTPCSAKVETEVSTYYIPIAIRICKSAPTRNHLLPYKTRRRINTALIHCSSLCTYIYNKYIYIHIYMHIYTHIYIYIYKHSQRHLTADWLAPLEICCSRMRSTVSSDWLPSYIKVTRRVLEIFKMAWYLPDSPLYTYNCMYLFRIV
jgi:hypothetical protein